MEWSRRKRKREREAIILHFADVLVVRHIHLNLTIIYPSIHISLLLFTSRFGAVRWRFRRWLWRRSIFVSAVPGLLRVLR